MATFHLSVKTVSRSTGRSAVAAAAYRAGERLTNARDQMVHDYDRRGGVAARVLLVPDGAGDLATMEGDGWRAERERLWNAAEAREKRRDAKVAREYEVALPAELDEVGRRALAVGFAREVVTRFGVAADVAVHEPSREGDQRNHHAHILTTTRKVEAGGELGAKTRELDDPRVSSAHVEALRALWAIQVNVALERIQAEARVDHRSYARQGLALMPGYRMGTAATAMERREQRKHDERDGGPDVAPPVTRRGKRRAELEAIHARAQEEREEAEWIARRRREAEERERRAEARRERELQEEANRAAEMAARAPQKPAEVPSASPRFLDVPQPGQAPQRPLEAEHRAWRAEAERVARERRDAEERERVEARRERQGEVDRAAAGAVSEAPPEPFELSGPDEAAWLTVRERLVRERRLSERIVDGLRRLGLLIPRPRGFLLAMRDLWGHIVGAELYDEVGYIKPVSGSRPDRGGVWLSRGTPGRPRDVYLTETGLDALRLHEQIRPDPDRQQVFVSAAGARPRVAWLHELLEWSSRLFVAYNTDLAGKQAAQALMAQYPAVPVRWVPEGTDWGAYLAAVGEAEERARQQVERQAEAARNAARAGTSGDEGPGTGPDPWDDEEGLSL